MGFVAHYMHIRIRGPVTSKSNIYEKSTQDCLDEILESQEGNFLHPDILSDLGRVQEVFYNVGRIFQTVQMNHVAHRMYERALELADRFPQLKVTKMNLTKEAAFNLYQIYRMSGASDLALDVLDRYLTFD